MALNYFLLTQYIIPIINELGPNSYAIQHSKNYSIKQKIKHYKQEDIKIENKLLVNFDDKNRIYIAFYNIDIGHLVIESESRLKAYQISKLISYLIIIKTYSLPLDNQNHFTLQELSELPQPEWDEQKLLNELKKFYNVNENILKHLKEGIILDKETIQFLSENIKKIKHNNIINTINNLLESRFIYNGQMDHNFYLSDYINDRQNQNDLILEKRYLENRYRYESAFLAAFKGIESFFGVNDIKKNKVKELFIKIKYKEIYNDKIYIRKFEKYLGLEKTISFDKLILHFLNFRNVVAAHSNKNPPEKFKIYEDNIFEIQQFLEELIYLSTLY